MMWGLIKCKNDGRGWSGSYKAWGSGVGSRSNELKVLVSGKKEQGGSLRLLALQQHHAVHAQW